MLALPAVVVLSSFIFVQSDEESSRQQPPPSTDTSVIEGPDITELSIDDLIDRLPPAGCEWRWDRARNDSAEDAASEELARRIAASVELTDEQWKRALLSTGAICFHPKWPKGEEYRISLTVPRWLGFAQIRLDPRPKSMRATSVGRLMQGFSGTGASIDARDARLGRCTGPLPDGATSITFEVEVERGEVVFADLMNEKPPPPGMLWEGAITIPVEQVESFADIAEPIDDEELTLAVRDAIGAGFRPWGRERKEIPFLVIDPDCQRFPELRDMALDLKVEIFEGEELLTESWLVAKNFDTLALASSIQQCPHRYYGSANLKIPEAHTNPKYWTLKITGQCEHIDVLWHARQYWSGSITIPWFEAVAHENERTAPHGRGPEMSTPYWR